MKHKRPPVPAIILVLLLITAGVYYGLQNLFAEENGGLSASGTIEAVEVDVSPEMAGKVAQVLVDESELVEADAPLLALDPSLLTAQRAVALSQIDTATAALKTAQDNYDLVLQNALVAQQKTTASDWRFSAPDEFSLPLWYFDQPEKLASAQAEVDDAVVDLLAAQDELATLLAEIGSADFLAVEEHLNRANTAFLVAKEVKIQTEYASPEGSSLRSASYDAYNAAEDELNAAEEAYYDLLSSTAADDILDARGKIMVAQQRYDVAYARLVSLQTGVESPAVLQAQNALDQAQTAISQAQANLALLDTQIEKLTIYAPVSGTVLARNIEPGEFAQPGATLLILADLSDLKITVYVPEDRYGAISLGQQATLTVDSFPGITFSATVIYISSAAEFTPRNVQTVEGRSSTVYAVKLKVDDPDGKLKPGMPADVVFVQ